MLLSHNSTIINVIKHLKIMNNELIQLQPQNMTNHQLCNITVAVNTCHVHGDIIKQMISEVALALVNAETIWLYESKNKQGATCISTYRGSSSLILASLACIRSGTTMKTIVKIIHDDMLMISSDDMYDKDCNVCKDTRKQMDDILSNEISETIFATAVKAVTVILMRRMQRDRYGKIIRYVLTRTIMQITQSGGQLVYTSDMKINSDELTDKIVLNFKELTEQQVTEVLVWEIPDDRELEINPIRRSGLVVLLLLSEGYRRITPFQATYLEQKDDIYEVVKHFREQADKPSENHYHTLVFKDDIVSVINFIPRITSLRLVSGLLNIKKRLINTDSVHDRYIKAINVIQTKLRVDYMTALSIVLRTLPRIDRDDINSKGGCWLRWGSNDGTIKNNNPITLRQASDSGLFILGTDGTTVVLDSYECNTDNYSLLCYETFKVDVTLDNILHTEWRNHYASLKTICLMTDTHRSIAGHSTRTYESNKTSDIISNTCKMGLTKENQGIECIMEQCEICQDLCNPYGWDCCHKY